MPFSWVYQHQCLHVDMKALGWRMPVWPLHCRHGFYTGSRWESKVVGGFWRYTLGLTKCGLHNSEIKKVRDSWRRIWLPPKSSTTLLFCNSLADLHLPQEEQRLPCPWNQHSHCVPGFTGHTAGDKDFCISPPAAEETWANYFSGLNSSCFLSTKKRDLL